MSLRRAWLGIFLLVMLAGGVGALEFDPYLLIGGRPILGAGIALQHRRVHVAGQGYRQEDKGNVSWSGAGAAGLVVWRPSGPWGEAAVRVGYGVAQAWLDTGATGLSGSPVVGALGAGPLWRTWGWRADVATYVYQDGVAVPWRAGVERRWLGLRWQVGVAGLTTWVSQGGTSTLTMKPGGYLGARW